ncbi:MAG: hypothetical protein AB8B56_00160 [Crocinitomicaceae bacterium]
MKSVFFLWISLAFMVSSCIKNNPAPSWIEIKEWQLVSNPNSASSAGELRHNITDVQVVINNKFIGIFEVPCKVPVLTSGESIIRLLPVIRNNGISATKKVYPFLEPYELDTLLVKNGTISINPSTRYFENLDFWIEDFENATSAITQDQGSAITIDQVSDPLIADMFSGNKFGRISLNQANDFWIGYTDDQTLVLPKGQDVYMEIDFHNTNRIKTGLLAIGPNGIKENPNIQLNTQDEAEVVWKKVYIDLREIVSSSQDAEYFELTFEAILDESDVTGVVNLDNIKLIHF